MIAFEISVFISLKSYIRSKVIFDCFIQRYYKNTTRVELPEVDFSFHEDNHKVKEMTEVTLREHEASFIESYHPPRFMSIKFMKEVNGNEGGYGKPWAVISLTLWLSSWKEKSTSGKSTLVVFLYSISDNPRSKND